MAESSKPVGDGPAETSAAIADTSTAVEQAQVSDKTETVPAVKTSTGAVVGSTADTTPVQTVPMVEKTTEGVNKSADKAGPFDDAMLGYKDPGTMMGKFKFSKRHVWFGDGPVTTQNMSHYLRAEKPEVAHPVTAWASQTGKGLLFLTKQADQKAQPHGALNLSEASEVAKEGIVDFSFKINGHRHIFQATTMRERDGWFLAIDKAVADAKAKREDILSSDGYKETIGKLDKPAVMANAAAEHSTPKKSTDLKSSDETRVGGRTDEAISDEEKKKKKSRSASRGKRTSIFGAILGGKDGYEKHDEAKAISRKSEDTKGKEKVIEPAEEVQEVPIVASPEVTASSPTEPAVESAKPVDAKAEDIPVASTERTEEMPKTTTPSAAAMPAKPTKRASIFGQFFDRVRTPGHEKKEYEFVPTVSSKDGGDVASPVQEPVATTDSGPVAVATESNTESAAAKDVIASKETKEGSLPKKEEKENLLGKFLNRDRSKSPAADSRKEKKDVIVPVAASTEASAPSTDVTSAAGTPATEAPVAATTATPEISKDKRRTSFFGNLGSSAKKEKRPTEVNTEADKSPNEHKPNSPIPRLGSIFRKPSHGVKSSKTEKTVDDAGVKNGEASQAGEKPATTLETPIESAESTTPADAAVGTSSTKPKDESVVAKGVNDEKNEDSTPVIASTA